MCSIRTVDFRNKLIENHTLERGKLDHFCSVSVLDCRSINPTLFKPWNHYKNSPYLALYISLSAVWEILSSAYLKGLSFQRC